MALPKDEEIEVPLLREIEALGGQASPQHLYPRVTTHFSQITESDLREKTKTGANKWTNRIRFVRQRLKEKGELDSPSYGVWRITEKGKERLKPLPPPPPPPPPPKRVHEELKGVVEHIAQALGKPLGASHGYPYIYDVLWRDAEYKKDPSLVVEICDKGSVDKDITSLRWAVETLGATALLVTVDDKDFDKAKAIFGARSGILVIKAQALHQLHDLIRDDNIQLLRALFG